MAKKKKKSNEPDKAVNYVMICEHCGFPQTIPELVIKTYFPIKGMSGIYCDCCNKLNEIPEYLKKISIDL